MIKRLTFRISGLLSAFVLIMFLSQDIQIFPPVLFHLFSHPDQLDSPPAGVESNFVPTSDGESINYWRLKPTSEGPLRGYAAVIFHGNGGALPMFVGIQEWLSGLGAVSYGFDYRGYGLSSGWPSEDGIYRDGEAVLQEVLNREKIGPEKLILYGLSIGTGFAAKKAASYQPAALVLVSPYISIPEVAAESFITRLLTPLLRYQVSTSKYVSEVKKSCFFVAHGRKDDIIPFSHGEKVYQAYKGSGVKMFLDMEDVGHNDAYYGSKQRLGQLIASCVQEPSLGS